MESRNFEQRTRENSRITNITNNTNQNRIRLVNNSNTIYRISRIITPQVTRNQFENDFFNGAKFHDSDDLETLILSSTGFLGSTSLFP